MITTGGEFTYDGRAHGATVAVDNLPKGYTLEKAASSATATNVADGEVAATADILVIRNAQGTDVTSKLNIKKVDGTIKILPATLTVTTEGGTWNYDGKAHGNDKVQVSGLAEARHGQPNRGGPV